MRPDFFEGDWFLIPPTPLKMDIEYKVGDSIGTCDNCQSKVVLAPPRLSKMQTVGDGFFKIRCSNPNCHNYCGTEAFIWNAGLADFVIWDEKLIEKKDKEHEDIGQEEPLPENVIMFRRKKKR